MVPKPKAMFFSAGRPASERFQEVQLAHRILDGVGRKAALRHCVPDRGPDRSGHARADAQPRHRSQRPRAPFRRKGAEETVDDCGIGRVERKHRRRRSRRGRSQRLASDRRSQADIRRLRADGQEHLLTIRQASQANQCVAVPGAGLRVGRHAACGRRLHTGRCGRQQRQPCAVCDSLDLGPGGIPIPCRRIQDTRTQRRVDLELVRISSACSTLHFVPAAPAAPSWRSGRRRSRAPSRS